MPKHTAHKLATLFSLTLAFGLAGCGGEPEGPQGPLGKVHGMVTIDGDPAPAGTTVLLKSDKHDTAATVGDDGTWRVTNEYGDEIPVGEYKVWLRAPAPKELSPEEAMKLSDAGTPPEDELQLPKKWTSAETSGETVTVKEGEDTEFNVGVKTK